MSLFSGVGSATSLVDCSRTAKLKIQQNFQAHNQQQSSIYGQYKSCARCSVCDRRCRRAKARCSTQETGEVSNVSYSSPATNVQDSSKSASSSGAAESSSNEAQDNGEQGDDTSTQSKKEDTSDNQEGPMLTQAQLRQLSSGEDPADVLDKLYSFAEDLDVDPSELITPKACQQIVQMCLQKGNYTLALDLYKDMSKTKVSGGLQSQASVSWPKTSLDLVREIVYGLTRALRVQDALNVVQQLSTRGQQASEDVQFGKLVAGPFPPFEPIAVVQPDDPIRTVSDSNSRYQYELYTGVVSKTDSEALEKNDSIISKIGKVLGFRRFQKQAGSVHSLIVTDSEGLSRTFKFGTDSPALPANDGDLVTIVCVPDTQPSLVDRVVRSTPPNTVPGQSVSITNHTSGANYQLLPSVAPMQWDLQTGLAIVPIALLAVTSDPAKADPLTTIGISTAVVASARAAWVSFDNYLPKIRQLKPGSIAKEEVQQGLLAQLANLRGRSLTLVSETNEDIRLLARLYQLEDKMASINSDANSLYGTRLKRVETAGQALWDKLSQRLELIDQYGDILKMIEIEVELDVQLPVAELKNIEEQIDKLFEADELFASMEAQVEATDEVERLLKSEDKP